MSFLLHDTLGRGDQKYVQSWLLSWCATPLGWLCHPAQTTDRQSLVLFLSWTCQLKPARTGRGTGQPQRCSGAVQAGRISAPLTHGTGLAPNTNSNVFPIGMKIHTEKTKNWWPEHDLIVKSDTPIQMNKVNIFNKPSSPCSFTPLGVKARPGLQKELCHPHGDAA